MSFREKDNLWQVLSRVPSRPRRVFGGQYGFPPPGSTDAGGTGRQDSKVYTTFARWNRVFTPTFLNEFQASASRSTNSSGTLADDTDWAKAARLPESLWSHRLADHLHGQPVLLLRLLGRG